LGGRASVRLVVARGYSAELVSIQDATYLPLYRVNQIALWICLIFLT
jgi:hypothetical protein